MELLADVNVLFAFVAECSVHHAKVRSWWRELPGNRILYVCRPVQAALLRLLSTLVVMGPEVLTLPQAWCIYAGLLATRRFSFALEPRGLDPEWERLCRPFKDAPKVVSDSYLAAFAIAGGYRLITLDKAFSQFRGLDCTVLSA